MRTDYQNLQDEDHRRYWSHGRIWLRRAGEWYNRRFGTLQIEWTVPCGHCGWGVTIGGGDSGSDLGFTLAIPFVCTVYVTLDRVFPRYVVGTDFERGHDRQISCYFADWTFRYSLWVGSMASWSRQFPWCRWWRQGSIDFKDLILGRARHTLERRRRTKHETIWMPEDTVEYDLFEILIPMPEGAYPARAHVERRTWKRPRWPWPIVRVSVAVDIPKGIPFAGKGENSWDCGDDGLFGYGAEGDSIEHAIGHGVESVLTSRRRYGKPSPQAIREALGA